MTFTMQVKEEIALQNNNLINNTSELSSFIKYNGNIKNDKIVLTMENELVAKHIYTLIKEIFMISPKVMIRIQHRFRIHKIYSLIISDKVNIILEKLNIKKDGKSILPEEYFLSDVESKKSYLVGLFLACGSINNPEKSGYHMEFVVSTRVCADYINKLIHEFNIESKVLKRNNKYMIYIKQAEMISDMLKIFNATNSMFFFEDIRIYRDHKNMVNRLNNVDLANQEKVISTGLKQIDDINYLIDNDLMSLLDEKIQLVCNYRLKYKEVSLSELAHIVSLETNKPITKSGINHYFRKVKELVNKHKNN